MATNNPNGPHNNYVGAGFTGTGKHECPFCGETQVAAGKWACGMFVGSLALKVQGICSKTNGPHNNVVGAHYHIPQSLRTGCVFCGESRVIGITWACGMKGDGSIIKSICGKLVMLCGPAPVIAASNDSVMSRTHSPLQPEKMVRPTINCPACGAYCAHKHRIGCKAVVTC